MATNTLKTAAKFSWNSPQGKVIGSVNKKLIAPTGVKTHHVAALPEHPQLLVKSDCTGQVAAHKPATLKRV